MVVCPEVQRRGQQAVDKVLLGQRLPDFSDFGSIPYVDAIVKEVLRWRPVVPLGAYFELGQRGYLLVEKAFRTVFSRTIFTMGTTFLLDQIST